LQHGEISIATWKTINSNTVIAIKYEHGIYAHKLPMKKNAILEQCMLKLERYENCNMEKYKKN